MTGIGMAGLALAAAAVAGCATESRQAASAQSVDVPLAAARTNAGEVGRATLVPTRDDKTQVRIVVSGVPGHVSRPVHLYSAIHGGRCGNLSTQAAYELDRRVLAGSTSNPTAMSTTVGGPLEVTNIAPVPLATLQGKPHAIAVRTSPADGSQEIFCGDIPTA